MSNLSLSPVNILRLTSRSASQALIVTRGAISSSTSIPNLYLSALSRSLSIANGDSAFHHRSSFFALRGARLLLPSSMVWAAPIEWKWKARAGRSCAGEDSPWSRIRTLMIPGNSNISINQSPLIKLDLTKDRVQRIHGQVSTLPVSWKIVHHESGNDFTDIIYEKAVDEGIAKITINRPERRNVLRPRTIKELIWAFNDAREDLTIGVIILAGQGSKAFCSGGDQTATVEDGSLNLMDLQEFVIKWVNWQYCRFLLKSYFTPNFGSVKQ